MKALNTNKSPGIDGLLIEFYLKFYNIIKNEFCEVLCNSLKINCLTESQRKALIILLFKGGDIRLISSWRPISLICVDTKILSKLIAHRIGMVLNKCISQEQFCGKERSIVECNNTTRDLVYYINESKSTGALINIDLQKAFDSLDHSFLFKIMKKMGFAKSFIQWIKLFLYRHRKYMFNKWTQGGLFQDKKGCKTGLPLVHDTIYNSSRTHVSGN